MAAHNSSLVFEGFKASVSAPRPFNELTILELLRSAYPTHHATCASTAFLDLPGYAQAGHAELTIDDSDRLYDATRHYIQSVNNKGAFPAKLEDVARFRKFAYKWQEKNFIVYELRWMESWGRPTHVYFILRSLDKETPPARNHPDTDSLLHAAGAWSTALHDEIYVFDNGFWNKSSELFASVRDCTWDEVILSPTTKANLIADVQGFFDNKALYKALSVPWKRGVILYGVPGNGKTVSIKALISTLWNGRADPIPSLYVKSFDGCNGRGGAKSSICSIFSHARVMAPCLLIFEDLDSLVTDETRSYFLNEVDGLESNDGILMIGSTNHLDSLDPAISKRPSRFDRKYHFKLPSEAERVLYCEYWRKKIGEANEIVKFEAGTAEVVAGWTEGFSFAYLKELFVVALLAIARGKTGAVESVDEEEDHDEVDVDDDVPNSSSEDGKSSTPGSEPVIVERPSADTTTSLPPTATLKPKRTLPAIEIPTHLQDDLLLTTIKAQLKILLKEMDTTPESEWPSERKKVTAGRVNVGVRHSNVDIAHMRARAKNVGPISVTNTGAIMYAMAS